MSSIDRRRFLGTAAAAIAAAAWQPGRAAAAAQGRFTTLRRAAGIFVGRGGTIGWVVGRDAALLVDSQMPDSAAACLDGMRRRTSRPIAALVDTHHHGDHTGGHAVFRPEVDRIVAHERVPRLQRAAARERGAGREPVVADTIFSRTWSLDLGGETAVATYRGPAHTGGDASVHLVEAGIVHVGDLVFNRLFPFIDVAGGASVRGWIRALEAIAAEHPDDTVFVFGHGSSGAGVTGSRADLLLQRDLLAAMLEHVERGRAAGLSREEVTSLGELPGFPHHRPVGEFLTLRRCLEAVWEDLERGGAVSPRPGAGQGGAAWSPARDRST